MEGKERRGIETGGTGTNKISNWGGYEGGKTFLVTTTQLLYAVEGVVIVRDQISL